jgi:hypothetical protein
LAGCKIYAVALCQDAVQQESMLLVIPIGVVWSRSGYVLRSWPGEIGHVEMI